MSNSNFRSHLVADTPVVPENVPHVEKVGRGIVKDVVLRSTEVLRCEAGSWLRSVWE